MEGVLARGIARLLLLQGLAAVFAEPVLAILHSCFPPTLDADVPRLGDHVVSSGGMSRLVDCWSIRMAWGIVSVR